LQVHPNDEQARRLAGPGFYGKTEAWYVVEADPGAQLISGFRPGVTRQEIQAAVGNKTILDIVENRNVKAGIPFSYRLVPCMLWDRVCSFTKCSKART